jgi:hypothetical protein
LEHGFRRHAEGTFQAASNYTANGARFVTAADLNGDGFPDLITNGSVLLGNGDGTFQAARTIGAGGAVAVGDFNGDGIPDLAAISGGAMRVLLGHGDGAFQTPPGGYLAGTNPTSVAVGDLNGDGLPDLAAANNGSNDVSILLNDGAWASPSAGPGGRPNSHHGSGLPIPPAVRYPSRVEAAPVDAVFSAVQPAAGAVPATNPPPEEAPPPPHGHRAPVAPRLPLPDLSFTPALATGLDGRLGDVRGTWLA